MSITIHLLTRQAFPPGLRLRATWDDPADTTSRRGAYGVVVGLSDEPVRELSTAKLRSAMRLDESQAGARTRRAKAGAGDVWVPRSRVFLDKGSPTALDIGEALVDALGGVMVLEGWVDNYRAPGSLFYLSENVPSVALSPDELRALFKKKVAEAKRAAKKAAVAAGAAALETFRQRSQEAAAVVSATLEKASGPADPLPPLQFANDDDRALYDAVQGLLGKGELPVLLGLASTMEYGVQRGFACCLTTSRLLVVPVDVQLMPAPSHRFADPIRVRAKPDARPVYDVKRAAISAFRLRTLYSVTSIRFTPHLDLSLEHTSPHPLLSDQTEPLTNQPAFLTHLPLELVRGGAKWDVDTF